MSWLIKKSGLKIDRQELLNLIKQTKDYIDRKQYNLSLVMLDRLKETIEKAEDNPGGFHEDGIIPNYNPSIEEK